MHFSITIDGNIVRKALSEGEVLYTAADCGLSYLALVDKLGEQAPQSDFWLHTRSALMGSFVINWCKLFGVDVKDQYWKQTTLEQKPFRELVYQATGFSYQQWDKYRKAMSDLKAVVVEHMNPYYPIDQMPDFKPAIEILKVCHEWLRLVVEEFAIDCEGPITQANYFDKVEADIADTLEKL